MSGRRRGVRNGVTVVPVVVGDNPRNYRGKRMDGDGVTTLQSARRSTVAK